MSKSQIISFQIKNYTVSMLWLPVNYTDTRGERRNADFAFADEGQVKLTSPERHALIESYPTRIHLTRASLAILPFYIGVTYYARVGIVLIGISYTTLLNYYTPLKWDRTRALDPRNDQF